MYCRSYSCALRFSYFLFVIEDMSAKAVGFKESDAAGSHLPCFRIRGGVKPIGIHCSNRYYCYLCDLLQISYRRMKEDRTLLHRYAMHLGTYMGVYWILKFILFPLSFNIPFFALLFWALTLAVPFMGYHYVKLYRDKACGGTIDLSRAVLFAFLMYAFAALLVSVGHFIYFRFIDHGMMLDSYVRLWNEFMNQNPELGEHRAVIEEAIASARELTPIRITVQLLSWNILWACLLAIPTGMPAVRHTPGRLRSQGE